MRRLMIALILLSAAACQNDQSSTAATGPATVLVNNASCEAGHCMTLEVRGYITTFLVPQLPIGLVKIAEVHPGQHCIALPDTLSLTITGPDETGRIDTVVDRWDQTDGISLAAFDSALYHGPDTAAGVDSADNAIYPYDGVGPAIGETAIFVPNQSAGWAVTYPSAPPGQGTISHSSHCKP